MVVTVVTNTTLIPTELSAG